ncbi:hypothetical protein K6U06_09540 [Acidiferrimicrobium sp. IK]|uniref:hypothetical protein n=1 Tax=Acidiferrimicrobium sp. IK TaxID=2871700 RepID=UPI0021CB7D73|nr:hypothetical protein [Acidiferrimicrobium sp. IK]MCU4184600.1 hypothetical protein [Acidiferrimicrobium sp. IK]
MRLLRGFLRRHHRQALAVLGAACLLGAAVPAVDAPRAAAAAPALNCPAEQYPAANAPRSAPARPYEIPFKAQFNGGYLALDSGVATVVLGPPSVQYPTGQIFGPGCGLLSLPGLSGAVDPNPPGYQGDPNYNNNIQFQGPNGSPTIPVSIGIVGLPGVDLAAGYGAAEGSLTATMSRTPAPNGGLMVDMYGNAKATDVIDVTQLLALLPSGGQLDQLLGQVPGLQSLLGAVEGLGGVVGSDCTIALGDLVTDGLPPGEVQALEDRYHTSFRAPAHLTSGSSGDQTGVAATGPATDAQLTLVGNDFAVPPVDPDLPPVPGLPGVAPGAAPSSVCAPPIADLLNALLGLPSAPGKATFVAPAKLAIEVPY